MLELLELSRRYGTKIALDRLTFTVPEGSVVGFLGPNGAGKTTAMRAVLGIVTPDSGSVMWNSKPVDLPTRLRFGYMPEERGLYSTMHVIDQLIYLGRLHGMSRVEASNSAEMWLERLGMAESRKLRLDALSLGNQQRVQMAAALIHSPDLLVLDEPFSGLDPMGIEALGEVLRERARQGTAVVFSSHQLDLVEGLCERVVIINNGREVTTGSIDELTVSRNTLRVAVAGDVEASWLREIEGIDVLEVDEGRARIRLVDGTSSDAVLDAARRAGSVTHFTFERKRLSEVFREAVAS